MINVYNKVQQNGLGHLRDVWEDIHKLEPGLPSPDILDTLPPVPVSKGDYSSIPERRTNEVMNALFPGAGFMKIRPSWLKNPLTGKCMELDCYSKDLSIAVEYNGVQHYEWPNFTNMSRDDFYKQKARDELKERLCIKEDVCLIRVPYTTRLADIGVFLYCKLLESVPPKQLT